MEVAPPSLGACSAIVANTVAMRGDKAARPRTKLPNQRSAAVPSSAA